MRLKRGIALALACAIGVSGNGAVASAKIEEGHSHDRSTADRYTQTTDAGYTRLYEYTDGCSEEEFLGEDYKKYEGMYNIVDRFTDEYGAVYWVYGTPQGNVTTYRYYKNGYDSSCVTEGSDDKGDYTVTTYYDGTVKKEYTRYYTPVPTQAPTAVLTAVPTPVITQAPAQEPVATLGIEVTPVLQVTPTPEATQSSTVIDDISTWLDILDRMEQEEAKNTPAPTPTKNPYALRFDEQKIMLCDATWGGGSKHNYMVTEGDEVIMHRNDVREGNGVTLLDLPVAYEFKRKVAGIIDFDLSKYLKYGEYSWGKMLTAYIKQLKATEEDTLIKGYKKEYQKYLKKTGYGKMYELKDMHSEKVQGGMHLLTVTLKAKRKTLTKDFRKYNLEDIMKQFGTMDAEKSIWAKKMESKRVKVNKWYWTTLDGGYRKGDYRKSAYDKTNWSHHSKYNGNVESTMQGDIGLYSDCKEVYKCNYNGLPYIISTIYDSFYCIQPNTKVKVLYHYPNNWSLVKTPYGTAFIHTNFLTSKRGTGMKELTNAQWNKLSAKQKFMSQTAGVLTKVFSDIPLTERDWFMVSKKYRDLHMVYYAPNTLEQPANCIMSCLIPDDSSIKPLNKSISQALAEVKYKYIKNLIKGTKADNLRMAWYECTSTDGAWYTDHRYHSTYILYTKPVVKQGESLLAREWIPITKEEIDRANKELN